ncbi:hypothetical protein ABK040_007456 [Willaertia magna]
MKLEEHKAIIEEATKLYKSDKSLDAYLLLKNIIHSDEDLTNFDHFVSQIYLDGKLSEKLIKELESNDGWAACIDKDRIKSFYKQKSNGIHELKLEGVIDAPIFQVLSIFYEIDLYKNWVATMENSTIIQTFESKYKFISYFSFNLPWPLTNRNIFSYAFALDRLTENKSVLIIVKGINPNLDNKYAEVIKTYKNDSYVTVDCEYAGVLIKYVNENETFVQIIGSCDPKLSYVPNWFLNLVTTNFSSYCITKLRQLAAKVPQSEYQTRIQSKDEVYGDIIRRLNLSFEMNAMKEENQQTTL